jgi:hypothetical protein
MIGWCDVCKEDVPQPDGICTQCEERAQDYWLEQSVF